MFALPGLPQLPYFFNNEPKIEETPEDDFVLINYTKEESLTKGVSDAVGYIAEGVSDTAGYIAEGVSNTAGYIAEGVSNTAGYITEGVLGTKATRKHEQDVIHPKTGKKVRVTLYLEGEISDMDVLHELADFQECPEGYDYEDSK